MELKRKALNPTPPRPFPAEQNRPIRLAGGITIPIDEAFEELEPEDREVPAASNKAYSKLSSKYLAAAAETLELDPDFDVSITINAPAFKSKSSTAKPTPAIKSPIVLAAETLSTDYRSTHPKNRASPASLRAYFIWYHNNSLSCSDIAALLREVPLQTTTVVNYILEAVKLEKLPFEKERLRKVLGVLPKEIAGGRYKTLLRAVEWKDVNT